MIRIAIALALLLVAQEASAQCAGERVNYFWQVGCIPCGYVQAFLDRNGVHYAAYNIADRGVQQYMREHFGIVASPIVQSRGYHVLGYNELALRELLCR